MTAAPKLLMTLWMMMLPTEIKLCCKMLGMAMTANRPKWFHEKIFTFPSVGIFAKRRKTTTSASTQLIPWHKNVAQATPATPMLNAVTNRISTAILDVDEQVRKINGVLESPSAEKMPVATL